MSTKSVSDWIVKELQKELNGQKRESVIEVLEETILEGIDLYSQSKAFYTLPIDNIFSIFSKIEMSEVAEPIPLIAQIIQQTKQQYPTETNKLLQFLSLIKCTNETITIPEIIRILEVYDFIPLFNTLCSLYETESQTVTRDYEAELNKTNFQV